MGTMVDRGKISWLLTIVHVRKYVGWLCLEVEGERKGCEELEICFD